MMLRHSIKDATGRWKPGLYDASTNQGRKKYCCHPLSSGHGVTSLSEFYEKTSKYSDSLNLEFCPRLKRYIALNHLEPLLDNLLCYP